ncbi:MAG: hypothetical protein CVU89_16580 [Firmicutes bacterium HGW-Firmicutes-14]|nr:MAG: hypothetical protein CVU89_16580 [Firmicutes bacterium HGW-Firmicutes-14]
MKSSYKPIGDFIRLVDERNTGLKVQTLLGLSIAKEFIPSVANIVGSDMDNYKIIRKNQFACSLMQVRRDKKMPVALLKEIDEAIISQAYPVFKIEDIEKLLPEYLMMWFSRTEFDREACFYAVGGVRGSLEWEDFCNMQLPVPSIEKQKEIVKEYSTIVNRIKLNELFNQKLEETAQAIFKRWFIDFEFPDENGKPYKSSGGEMEYNSETDGEIPKGWEISTYGKVIDFKTGKLNSNASVTDGKYPFFTCSNETFKTNTYSFDTEAVLLAGNNASAIYPLKYFAGKFDVYQRTYVLTSKDKRLSNKQIFYSVKSELENFKGVSSGTATKFLTLTILNDLKIVIANETSGKLFKKLIDPIFKQKLALEQELEMLQKLKDLILSKMTMNS